MSRDDKPGVLIVSDTNRLNTTTDESGLPRREWDKKQSILVEETQAMENERRLLEQQGMRRYGQVSQRPRTELEHTADNTLTQGVGPKEHPFLSSQRYQGVEPNLSPEPEIGTEARRQFDNDRREQEQEKQYRLGNMPQKGRKFNPEFRP